MVVEAIVHRHHHDVHRGAAVNGTFEVANASRLTASLWVGGDLETFDPDLACDQLNELVDAS